MLFGWLHCLGWWQNITLVPNYSDSLTCKSVLLQKEINLHNEEKKMPS